MENNNDYGSGVDGSDGGVHTPAPVSLNGLPQAQNVTAERDPVFMPSSDVAHWYSRFSKTSWIAFGVAGVLLAGTGTALYVRASHNRQAATNTVANVASRYDTQQMALGGILTPQSAHTLSTSNVAINGQLTLNQGLVIAPSVQPNAPKAGQLYFDQNTDQLAYYNGAAYVSLSGSDQAVRSIGGLSGQVTLGGGLSVIGNQLVATNSGALSGGVLSIGGRTGDISLGDGLKLDGGNLQNAGILSVSAGTPNLIVTDDGNGHVSISNVGAGSGSVSSSGGTAGILPLFTASQNIENSLVSQSGGTVNIAGSLGVSGSLSLGTVLSVTNGGTGTSGLAMNGVVVGQGNSGLTTAVAGGIGQCLLSTAGAPAFGPCPSAGSSGVDSLNGLTGALSVANATTSLSTITIDDATISSKGIASFNSANLTVTAGSVNTVQNIGTTASPTFTGVNTNTITPGGTLTVTGATANLLVQGGTATFGTVSQAGSIALSDGSSNTATITLSGHAANRQYTIPDTGADANFCLSTGNCIGAGGGAPNDATYLVATLSGTLTNERSLAGGTNVTVTDGGANSTMTVATVNNPSFSSSVTTPVLQSSGALTISSAAGTTVALDAGTTIELQDSTNITGNLDVSGTLTAGTANAFQISAAGAITTATGITSSGSVTFSGLNCTGNANGGALTTNGAGQLVCSDDDGGSGSAISGSGTNGTVALFSGSQTLTNSIITQSGTTVTVAGDLVLNTQLSVGNGGTGATSFTSNGVVYGNGTGALQVTGAGTGGQVLLANGSGVPTFVSLSGDVTVSATGVAAIQANSVALSTDTNGNYVANLGSLTGLSVTGNTGEGSTPALSVLYGSSANTAVEGNTSLTCPSGTGNLTGGGTAITLGAGGACGAITTVNNPSFSTSVSTPSLILSGAGSTGTLQVANLGQGTTFTLPDPGSSAATICLSTGNCAGAGAGVTTSGGTTNRLSKFTGSQAIGDSSISDTGTTVTVNGTANLVVQGGTSTLGTLSQSGTLVISDGSSNTVSIVTSALAADRTYTLPDAGGPAAFCLSSGNCLGGSGGAPNSAAYLLASLDGTLSNERALAAGTNITLNDGGANGNMTVATVNNPSFSTSVTTPVLQSSGALTISSGATTVAIDATTTIELQDSTNVTGSLDVSASFTAGTANAFTINSSGAITAATGITSSGTITFSGLNCTGNANGGALTANGSGQLVCSDDDGGSGSAISGSGTNGTIALFNGTQTIGNSIIGQSGTTITISGDLNLTTDLTVANGGTGASTFTGHGVLFGNDGGAIQVTAAGTGGQVLIAGAGGVPTFATFSGDVAVSSTGSTTIQADSVALGTDTTGNYVSTLGTLTGLSATGNTGEGSTPTLTVTYGSTSNTAVQGSVTLTCPSGTGNLTGGGTSITLGTGGTCGALSTVANPSFTTVTATGASIAVGSNSIQGTLVVSDGAATSKTATVKTKTTLGQNTTYNLPDPGSASADICLSSGNCSAVGTAGGDLTGSYPNPTIAKLQNTGLNITSPTAGHVLIYNATNSSWENHAVSSDIAISETGVATIQANAVALGTDTTGNYIGTLGTLTGLSTTGNTGEGSTPTLSVTYGSTASTAVQGNTTLTCPSGTGNLSGGGTSITLGTGGSCAAIDTVANPSFGTSVTTPLLQSTAAMAITPGGALTVGATAQSLTLQGSAASTITATGGGFTTTVGFTGTAVGTVRYNFDRAAAAGTYTICTTVGNCSGGNVTAAGGTTNKLAKFTGSTAIGDSIITDNGTTVSVAGALSATSVLSATFDTSSATALNIGAASPTTTAINLNQSATVAAGKSLTITGGNTASRPASPTEGMVYYDTTTKALLVYANGKWQSDRSTANKIVAMGSPSSCTGSTPVASANPDGADFVVNSCGSAQTTINAAIAALPSAGGTVYLMDGTYIADGSVSIPSNVTLAGAGPGATMLKQKDSSGIVDMVVNSNTSSGNDAITVRDLTVDGNKASNPSSSDCIFFSKVGTSLSSKGSVINNVVAQNCAYTAIYAYNSYNTAITQSRAISSYIGMSTFSSNNVMISNSVSASNSFGVNASGSSVTVTNSLIQNNATTGLDVESGSDVTATGNVISGGGGDGVFAWLASRMNLTGNTISNNLSNGIRVREVNNALISSNTIYNNGGSGADSGIQLYTSGSSSYAGTTITGNVITDTAGTGYAIDIADQKITKTYLSDNTFSGTGANSIHDLGTETIYANQSADGTTTTIKGLAGLGIGTTSAGNSLTVQGSIATTTLPAPAAPTVITQGTAGSTSYTYAVTALDGFGETLASTGTTIATGNATLNTTSFNRITWTRVGGAVSYKVYRTASSGTPSTTGLIGTVAASVATMQLDDKALAASGSTPAANTTGGLSLAGNFQFAQGQAHTISIFQASSGAGNDLTIAAGQSGTGANNGGNLLLQAGATGGSGTTGSVIVRANGTNSATAFVVQDSSSASLLTVDTAARSGSGGNLIKIGNSAGTDTALTILQLDAASAAPTTNLSALNGGMFYDSGLGKVSIIEAGVVKVLCNTTDLNCGTGGSVRLDQIQSATASSTLANAANPIAWNWKLTANTVGMSYGETTASTGGTGQSQVLLQAATLSGSTASPFKVVSNSVDAADIVFNLNSVGDLEFQDAGTAFLTLSDIGGVNLTLDATDSPTFKLDNLGSGEVGFYQTNGAFRIYDNSTISFAVDSNGNVSLGKNASGAYVTVGDATGQPTPNLFVLDNKGTAGDPSTVYTGAMYYNGITNKFRCNENSAWVDCIQAGSGGASTSLNNLASTNINAALRFQSTSAANVQFAAAATAAGNDLTIAGQSAGTTGVGGDLQFTPGAPGTNTVSGGSNAGTFTINAVTGQTSSGSSFQGGGGSSFNFNGGTGGTSNSGSSQGGDGGSFNVFAGNGGSSTIGTGGTGGNILLRAGDGGTGSGGYGGTITLDPGTATSGGVDGVVQIGNGLNDANSQLLVLDSSSASADPTGVNGAIYYNNDGVAGHGKFRCYEAGQWKNCTGMRDIVERRWGYIVPGGTSAITMASSGNLIAPSSNNGTISASNQVESNYISFLGTTTTNNVSGLNTNIFATGSTVGRYMPKVSARIRTDASGVTSSRYWVAQSLLTLAQTDPNTTSAAGTNPFFGLGASSAVSSGAWICNAGDGTNKSGTSTGVTITANHYYDIILDMSVAGQLTCSVSDNGAAFVSVTLATTVPTSNTSPLGIQASVTNLAATARAIGVAYVYQETN